MKSFTEFVAYNNTVPLVVSMVLLGGGAVFASTDGGQQALDQVFIGKVETVVSVDNTYIAQKNLSEYSPLVSVLGVTEDPDRYVVAYTLATIDIDEYVWKDVSKSFELIVTKYELKNYKTLAAFVQFQLKDIVIAEKDRLVRTQENQRKSITQKTVTTEYTGLIGSVLSVYTHIENPYTVAPSNDIPAPADQQAPLVETVSVPDIFASQDIPLSETVAEQTGNALTSVSDVVTDLVTAPTVETVELVGVPEVLPPADLNDSQSVVPAQTAPQEPAIIDPIIAQEEPPAIQ